MSTANLINRFVVADDVGRHNRQAYMVQLVIVKSKIRM